MAASITQQQYEQKVRKSFGENQRSNAVAAELMCTFPSKRHVFQTLPVINQLMFWCCFGDLLDINTLSVTIRPFGAMQFIRSCESQVFVQLRQATDFLTTSAGMAAVLAC